MSQNLTVVSPEPLASCLRGRGSMTEPLASCLGGRGEHDWVTSKLPERERATSKLAGRERGA